MAQHNMEKIKTPPPQVGFNVSGLPLNGHAPSPQCGPEPGDDAGNSECSDGSTGTIPSVKSVIGDNSDMVDANSSPKLSVDAGIN